MADSEEIARRLARISDGMLEQAIEAEETDAQPVEDVDVTIGIATFDDFDGAFFTITSLRLHHPEVMDRAEIVLVDNHPRGREASALRGLAKSVPRLRYVPVGDVTSTAVRDLIFRLAAAPVVVVLDSHVLVAPGGLAAAVDHLSEPGNRDLVQGPLVGYDGERFVGTHWEPEWRKGMFGTWAVDDRGRDSGAPPFDIPLQGLGLFASRRDSWPGLNPHFSGFGGEEGYLHEKVRQRGGRTLCLPALRWVHRFERPRGVSYSLRWEHRVRNYVIGWSELGLDVDPIREHFTGFLDDKIGEYFDLVREQIGHPLWRYDGVMIANDDLRPGRWRRSAEVLGTIGIEPRRLPTAGADAGELVEAARRYSERWGWRTALLLGDGVLATSDDLDGLGERIGAAGAGDGLGEDPVIGTIVVEITGDGAAARRADDGERRI